MEINPNWLGTEIERLIVDNKLFVMMSAGGWWFETTKLSSKNLQPNHRCFSEYLSNKEILEGLKEWLCV
jgi:hypothetical protein